MEIPDLTYDDVIAFITGAFSPAESIADASTEMTTDEVMKSLISHYGEMEITEKQLSLALKNAGYKSVNLPNTLQYVWIFKEKI